MGLFDFLKSKKPDSNQFITELEFKSNMRTQADMTPETMAQLRKIGVTPDKELKLEYFFYTNTAEKANIFSNEIRRLNYEVEHRELTGVKNLFIITGWTTKMKMENTLVANWTRQMCELGYKFDCDFDGWGTSPD